MCGAACTKIKDIEICMMFGYSERGEISVGNIDYAYELGEVDEGDRESIIGALSELTKEELIEAFLGLVENAYEA